MPGFATTTFGTTTTTGPLVFVPPIPAAFPEPNPLAPSFTLKLASTLGVFLALTLFMLIIIRLDPDSDKDSVGTRLKAYGRKASARPTEKATGILGKIPFLRGLTERAEEAARRRGVLVALNSALEQGNIPLRAGEAMAAGVGLGIIAAVMIGLFTQNLTMGLAAFPRSALAIGGRRAVGRVKREAPIRESASRHADASFDFTPGPDTRCCRLWKPWPLRLRTRLPESSVER